VAAIEETLRQRLRQAFTDASLPLPPDFALADDVGFDEIDGLDSVSRMRLVLTIEHAFSIRISPRENTKLTTIGQLVALIKEKSEGN
jgi:acyl carrier protein